MHRDMTITCVDQFLSNRLGEAKCLHERTLKKTYTDDTGKFAQGNPGRPKGARNKNVLAVENLLDGEAEGLTRKAVDLALDGDTTALRLCLERILPPRKDRPVEFDLPTVSNAGEAAKAAQAVLQATSEGS